MDSLRKGCRQRDKNRDEEQEGQDRRGCAATSRGSHDGGIYERMKIVDNYIFVRMGSRPMSSVRFLRQRELSCLSCAR